MSIVLKADNRQLTTNAEFTYLTTNYASAVASFVMTNVNNLSSNDYLLFGDFGSETSEILQISTVTAATKTVVTTANSAYAHPESTKITVIPYNQVRFYWSATSTDTAPAALATYQDIEADDFYSKYKDTTNTTGYGFFLFYNSTTLKATAFSNPIPYAGFGANTVSVLFDSFFSILNNKEQKLISYTDAFRWLNEGYNMARSQLGLVNDSYTVPASSSISIVSGTAEYDLPSDFSELVSLTDSTDGTIIPKMNLRDASYYRDSQTNRPMQTKYYLRNTKIGFVPTPTSSATYTLYYKGKVGNLDSLDDTVDFPNNEFYFLVDFMLYRASYKVGRPDPSSYLKVFQDRINLMKITSHKQDGSPSAWENTRPGDNSANV